MNEKKKQISLVFETEPDFNELLLIQDIEKFIQKYDGIILNAKHIKLMDKRD